MGKLAIGPKVIEVRQIPSNRDHFQRLVAFAHEVLDACADASVRPVLDGSLAVLARTRSPVIEVHDIDFSCSECVFPRLQQALVSHGIRCEIRPWHVLQARRDGLKIEFGAVEHWNVGIPDHHEPMRIAGLTLQVIGLAGLREQYRRGFENTGPDGAEPDLVKHERIATKLRLLDELP